MFLLLVVSTCSLYNHYKSVAKIMIYDRKNKNYGINNLNKQVCIIKKKYSCAVSEYSEKSSQIIAPLYISCHYL